MNKLSLYTLLILIFLGLSKSFSPAENQTPYLSGERVFPHYFNGAPISVILVDSYKTGFIIKTYFQRYKIVHGFSAPEYISIRTSQDFWRKNLKNIGMSIFRRAEGEDLGSTVPLPPGSLYIGKPAYGTWTYEQSGNKIWEFHRAYRHFPSLFHWQGFRPTDEFHSQMEIHLNNNQPFYGLNNEFGDGGSVTSNVFENTLDYHQQESEFSLQKHLQKKFAVPPWSIASINTERSEP